MTRDYARTVLNAVRMGYTDIDEATITAALRATGDIAPPDAPVWRRPEPVDLPVNPKRAWPWYATPNGSRATA